jgi:N-acetylglutamate synthase-like GNAT family acetyltransferase
MPSLAPVSSIHVPELTDFLSEVDLTVSGLDSPAVHLWIERDANGAIIASTGFELSDDQQHALIRSVAVTPSARSEGAGSRLARFALNRAYDSGARTAWLFSRRSGPFWQKLGFEPADRYELARVLATAHQVRQFSESGQLDQEVAWSRDLSR